MNDSTRNSIRKSPRERRLKADHLSVQQLAAESSIFSFVGSGTLPQRYRLVFDGLGISQDNRGNLQLTNRHEVLVELGASYPRMVPHLAWQTPIFHPNISHNGVVCLGGYGTHWVPSLTLSEMCTMLWDMIRYKNFDTESPYNREAAAWARSQTQFRFPLDARSIRDRVNQQSPPVIVQPEIVQPEIVPAQRKRSSPSDRRAVVTRVSSSRNEDDSSEPICITEDGIEIIETGIQIIESNIGDNETPPQVTRSQAAKPPEMVDGIMFID